VRSRDPILVLVLTGVVVGSLFGAGVGLVKYLADPYNQLPAMTFWLLGSLSAITASDVISLFGAIAVGAIVLIALRWRMNVISLPEEEARALGVATGPLRIAIVAAATLVTSASVAAAGIIGWVGLVVPHLARSLVGPDFARLLPAAPFVSVRALSPSGFILRPRNRHCQGLGGCYFWRRPQPVAQGTKSAVTRHCHAGYSSLECCMTRRK
jgi:ABC-type Fe3+-siderophore transport system permease subunit